MTLVTFTLGINLAGADQDLEKCNKAFNQVLDKFSNAKCDIQLTDQSLCQMDTSKWDECLANVKAARSICDCDSWKCASYRESLDRYDRILKETKDLFSKTDQRTCQFKAEIRDRAATARAR